MQTEDGSTPEAAENDDYWAEAEASKGVRGVFTNRLYAQHLGDGLLRLNFAEVLDEFDPQYHSALVMTADNAFAFGQLMQRMAMVALGRTPPPTPEESAENPNVQG